MKFNCLIPELRVFNLKKSLSFYTNILGFKVEYSRSDFAMLSLGECQIMLQKLTLPSRPGSWNVSDEMEYPLGRGINFQIILKDISPVYYSLKKNKVEIFIEPIVSDYKENEINNHVLEFLVKDPDGYLLRFQQDVLDWHFGDDEKTANELFDLAVKGEKCATSFLPDDKTKLQDELGFSILTDWSGRRRALVYTFKAYEKKFSSITKSHAFKEGEGDKTLEAYRKIHEQFFSKRLKEKGKKFDENQMIVCEEFLIEKIF